jgi:large subunit ribosomal protein L10
MSKYVKQLLTDHLRKQWQGVEAALLVNVSGMNPNASMKLRRELRQKNMHLQMVKNSLARLAADGTPLAPAFSELNTPTAVVWGGEDIVSLAKEVVRLARVEAYAPFGPLGGVMEGERLTGDDVIGVSKWPSRKEQLSILVGQILAPGANLSSQLLGPGRKLASQVKKKSEGAEEAPAEEAPAEEAAAPESPPAAGSAPAAESPSAAQSAPPAEPAPAPPAPAG